MTETNLSIPVREIFQVLAKDIARQVADNLIRDRIEPLEKRVDVVENSIVQMRTEKKTALDIWWKLAVITAGVFSIYERIFPHAFGR